MQSRRSFIKTSGITAIGAALLSDPFLKSCSQLSNKSVDEIVGQFSHTCEIIRPDDFLYLRYYFTNLKLKRRKLVKINDDADSYIIVRLPQQHVAEEVHKSKAPNIVTEVWSFDTETCEITFPDKDHQQDNFSKSFISGFSYLTFTLKKNQVSFEYNQDSLNNWNQFDLLTIQDLEKYPKDVPVSLLIGKNEYPLKENNFPVQLAVAKIQELVIPLTIIEAPYKLFLSPIAPYLRPEKETDYRYQFQKNNSVTNYYLSKDGKYKLTELWSNDLVFQISHPLNGVIKLPPNFKIVAYEEVQNLYSVTLNNISGTILIGNTIEYKQTTSSKPLAGIVISFDPSKNQVIINLIYGDIIFEEGHITFSNGAQADVNNSVSVTEGSFEGQDQSTFLLPNPNDFQRSNLAKLSNIEESNRDISSKYFNISALGITTFLEYFNLDEKNFKVVGWKQDIKLGRDNYVEITEKAIDCRSTLKLLVSQIAERRIEKGKSVIIYRLYFKYLEREKVFDDPVLFNDFLCKKITALGVGSYFIKSKILPDSGDEDNFIPSDECSNKIIKMPYSGIDQNGDEHKFLLDLLIIKKYKSGTQNELNFTKQKVEDILKKFNERISHQASLPINDQEHIVRFEKEKFGFAPTISQTIGSDNNKVKNSVLPTDEVQFYSIFNNENLGEDAFETQYPLIPKLLYAVVYPPQLEGVEVVPTPRFVTYCRSYKYNGFDEVKNITKVFLQSLSKEIKTTVLNEIENDKIFNEISKKAEAIKDVFNNNYKNAGPPVNPDIVINNLSALPQSLSFTDELNDRVNDVRNVRPADLLRGMNVEILGGIDLRKILKNIIPVEDSPVFNIIEDASEGFAAIQEYKQEYENLRKQIDNTSNEIASLEAQLKDAFNNAVKTYLDKYFETEDKIKQLDNKIKTDVTSEKKKFYAVFREQQRALEKNLNDEINRLAGNLPKLKIIADSIKAFFEDPVTIQAINTLVALKQIIDSIQYRADTINSSRLKNRPFDLTAINNLSDLIQIRNQVKEKVQELKLTTVATDSIKQKIISLFGSPLKDFTDSHPNIAHAVTKELFKFYLFEKSLNNEKVEINKEIYDILNSKPIPIGDDFEITTSAGKFYFKLQDNIDAIIEILNEDATELKNISDDYHKIFTDACSDVVSTSYKFMQLEIQKLNKAEDYLYNQVKYEISKEVDTIKESIGNTELYNSVKDDYFFFQSAYLEFLNIENGAKQIENMLSIDLSAFKNSYSTLLPDIRANIKEDLKKALQTATLNPKLSQVTNNLNNIITNINSVAFENVSEYVKAFADAETEIVNQVVNLYLKVDAKKQEIISEINNKKKQLNELKIQLRDFLKNKIQEKENELIAANKELIEAFQKGEQAVRTARDRIEYVKTQLDKIRAINKKEIRYSWKTNKFDDTNLGILKFITGKQQPTELSVDVVNTIKFNITEFPPHIDGISNEIKSKLSNFTINFLSILSVEFDNVSFVGGSEIKEKFDVAIRDVRFDGPLNFVQVFQSFLKSIDKGLRFDISLEGAVLGYEVCLPDITGGAFNFVNWKLVMELRLPFKAGVPMRLNFGLNTPQEMGLVSGAIWGGRGCFVIGVEPKRGIVSILLVIEVGVVLFLNIGVAQGIVYIFAGIYIKKEYDKVEIKGYLTCGGALNILGLITASVTFYLGLQGNGNYLEGYCTISYEIKIAAFIKISVSMSMYKRIYGCPDNSQRTDSSNNQQPQYGMMAKEFSYNKEKVGVKNMDIGSNKINFTNAEIDEYLEANFN